jgi:alpha-tubulin suppressor-like RCC1 family protein
LKTCVNKMIRRISTWGNGLKAQLGHGDVSRFRNINVIGLGAGITHSVALIKENTKGNVYIWGDNYYGQAGLIPVFMY